MRTPPRTATGRPCSMDNLASGHAVGVAGIMRRECSAGLVHGPITRPFDAGPGNPLATNDSIQVLGALALELVPGSDAPQGALSQQSAGELARLLAHDLATFAPEAATLELVTVGAHYDAVELLRPGWPLHRELDQLAARAPAATGGRVIAFGTHDGQLPGALVPSSDFPGGPLRLLPFV